MNKYKITYRQAYLKISRKNRIIQKKEKNR